MYKIYIAMDMVYYGVKKNPFNPQKSALEMNKNSLNLTERRQLNYANQQRFVSAGIFNNILIA